MRLVWAQYALDDRDAIFSYIESENPNAAVHVDEEIVRAVRRLLDFPESDRPGRVEGTVCGRVIAPAVRYSSRRSIGLYQAA
jgi:plasmid stabilization system protein ParE